MEAINNSPDSDIVFTFFPLFSKLYKLMVDKLVYGIKKRKRVKEHTLEAITIKHFGVFHLICPHNN